MRVQSLTALGIENAMVVSWDSVETPEGCDLMGYGIYYAVEGSDHWESAWASADETTLTIEDLTPATYSVDVYATYGEATTIDPPDFVALPQTTVPADCTITLKPVVLEEAQSPGDDPDNPRAHEWVVSWTNAGGGMTGCESGGVRLQWMPPGRTVGTWDSSHMVPNAEEDLKEYRHGVDSDFDAYGPYTFRVKAIKADGVEHHSNEVQYQFVDPNITTPTSGYTPDAWAPVNVVVTPQVDNAAWVEWDDPDSSGLDGWSIDSYEVEYRKLDSTDVQSAGESSLNCGADFMSPCGDRHMAGLEAGAYYTVRVVTGRSKAGETDADSPSAWSEYFRVDGTPEYRVWFIDNTPHAKHPYHQSHVCESRQQPGQLLRDVQNQWESYQLPREHPRQLSNQPRE